MKTKNLKTTKYDVGRMIFVLKLEWDTFLYLKWKFFDLIKEMVNLSEDFFFLTFFFNSRGQIKFN